MQFITALLGGTDNTILNSAFALGIVLVLIVLGLWLLKLLTRGTTNMARGRKRVAVIETAMVDGKRQLLIIRRDNVEHLILTGGPQDLVIESGIPAPEQASTPRRAAQRPPAPQPAAASADIATPIVPDRPVSRDAVDRLHDLARPAPLAPRTALRHTALLRPVERSDKVIPMGPPPRGDNSAGSTGDSVTPGPDGDGRTPMGGRGRFFRRTGHSDGR